jgi:hypothetical protein
MASTVTGAGLKARAVAAWHATLCHYIHWCGGSISMGEQLHGLLPRGCTNSNMRHGLMLYVCISPPYGTACMPHALLLGVWGDCHIYTLNACNSFALAHGPAVRVRCIMPAVNRHRQPRLTQLRSALTQLLLRSRAQRQGGSAISVINASQANSNVGTTLHTNRKPSSLVTLCSMDVLASPGSSATGKVP